MPKTTIEKYDEDEAEDNTTVMRGDNKVIYHCPVCGRNFLSARDYATHKDEPKSQGNENFPSIRRYIDGVLNNYGAYKKDLDVILSTLVSRGSHNKGKDQYYVCPLGDNTIFKDNTLLEYHLLKFHRKEIEGILFHLSDEKKATPRFGRLLTPKQIRTYLDKLEESDKAFTGQYRNMKAVFRCPFGHKSLFVGTKAFEDHILSSHNETQLKDAVEPITDEEVAPLTGMVERKVRFGDKPGEDEHYNLGTYYLCPLDHYRFKTSKDFEEHFNQHTPEEKARAEAWKKEDYK